MISGPMTKPMESDSITMILKFKTIITIGMLLVSSYSLGSEFTYNEAEQHWRENKETSVYQAYATKFMKYSKAHRLDSNLGCSKLGSEIVRQYLIINHGNSKKYAFVKDVVSNFDTPKSRCFIDSYNGMQVQKPPYLPFVLQMEFK